MLILLLAMQLAALSADDVVERAIDHHDPESGWATLEHTFSIRETRPDGTERRVELTLDHPGDRFVYEAEIGGDHVLKRLENGECHAEINGSTDVSKEQEKKYRTTCEQIGWYRNYYEYLIGMPMKLRDPGTIIHPKVSHAIIDGEELISIRVTYDDSVGSDVWYYYFDPESFVLRAARFYHDEEANDGELIVFDGEVTIEGMTLPQHRRWYRNADGEHIGTDSLID